MLDDCTVSRPINGGLRVVATSAEASTRPRLEPNRPWCRREPTFVEIDANGSPLATIPCSQALLGGWCRLVKARVGANLH